MNPFDLTINEQLELQSKTLEFEKKFKPVTDQLRNFVKENAHSSQEQTALLNSIESIEEALKSAYRLISMKDKTFVKIVSNYGNE